MRFEGYYFSLFSDAEALKVVKTDSKLGVDVAGKEASGVHVISRFLLIPENLVRLIFHCKASHISFLQQVVLIVTPARLPVSLYLRFVLKYDRLSMVTPVTELSIRGNVLLSVKTTNR
jgi:hypothetical protein